MPAISEKLKILIITREDPFSKSVYAGTEILAANLSFELVNQGHEVHMVFGSKQFEVPALKPANLKLHMLPLVSTPYLSALDYRRKCTRLCIGLVNKYTFDVVIAFGAGSFPGYIFDKIKRAKKLHPPLFYYAMDSMKMEYVRSKQSLSKSDFKSNAKKWIWYLALIDSDKKSCGCSDLILASSKDTINHLATDYEVPLDKIILLYEGIPDNFALGQVVSDPDKPTFLHIGGGPRKGTDYFLKAVKLLEQKYCKSSIAVIIRATESDIRLATKLCVEFHAYKNISTNELKRQYASCTVFVSPSLSEGFCLPIIEAAMFQKPSIVTNIGSLPELVVDGKTGLIAPVADINALAESLYQIITNTDLRKTLGVNAQKRAKDFIITAMVSRLLAIINEFVDNDFH
jgi:glycosyltransferase involved in cell wall biosynthesis